MKGEFGFSRSSREPLAADETGAGVNKVLASHKYALVRSLCRLFSRWMSVDGFCLRISP